jgi:hypothetical protein
MKNLLLAMSLAALSLTVVLVTMAVTKDDKDAQGPRHDASLSAPETLAVLSGVRVGLVVLVRSRYSDQERRQYTDHTLTRGLGIKSGEWTYLEVVVVNGRDTEVAAVDPSDLAFTATDGDPVPARDLRTLASDGAAARLLLEALAPPSDRPLGPKSTRRVVVGMPASRTFDELASGRWLGVDVRPARAERKALESWLVHEQPRARFLEAVLEDPKDDGGGDGR